MLRSSRRMMGAMKACGAEREHGLVSRAIDLIPIIETARGLSQIDAILAAGTRVKRIAFGAPARAGV